MRTLWKTINDITKFKKRSNLQITELLDKTGIKVTDHIKMANLLNGYFSEIDKKWQLRLTNRLQLTQIPQFHYCKQN